MADAISGETVVYQYDSLKRLISASTTGPQWGQSFGYDAFGNMLNQTVTKGSAPNMSVAVSGTTNRITTGGYSYDSNGNLTAAPNLTMTYNVENRLVGETGRGKPVSLIRSIFCRELSCAGVDWVKDVVDNTAGQITSMRYTSDGIGDWYITEKIGGPWLAAL